MKELGYADTIAADMVAIEQAVQRAAAAAVRFDAGKIVQIMHIGADDDLLTSTVAVIDNYTSMVSRAR